MGVDLVCTLRKISLISIAHPSVLCLHSTCWQEAASVSWAACTLYRIFCCKLITRIRATFIVDESNASVNFLETSFFDISECATGWRLQLWHGVLYHLAWALSSPGGIWSYVAFFWGSSRLVLMLRTQIVTRWSFFRRLFSLRFFSSSLHGTNVTKFILGTSFRTFPYFSSSANCKYSSLAVFYLISVTTGGFSSILAYVFSLLKGRQGLAGWRWIFVCCLPFYLRPSNSITSTQIIEGAITLFLAIVTWFFIPSFPDQNTFLTPKQTDLVLRRIDEDRGDAKPDELTPAKVKKHLSDWKLWAYGIIFMCNAMPSCKQQCLRAWSYKQA